MINEYVVKLVDNLPDQFKNNRHPIIYDIVLDGGAFNGSYHIGCLYFLKEMEKRNYIKIDRISGTSIGSVAGVLYFCDSLDEFFILYNNISQQFRKAYNLNIINDFKSLMIDKLTKNDYYKKISKKLFITYYNIVKGKKRIKSVYKDIDDIIDTIIRSMYIPYLIDGNMIYKNKYVDGITPYIFSIKNNKINNKINKKILYLDLHGYNKITELFCITNEKTNYHRVLSGLLDIHSFFIKQSNTSMCSFVNEWSYLHKCHINAKLLCEKIIVYIIYAFLYLKKNVPSKYTNNILYKLLSAFTYDIYELIIQECCI